MNAEKLAAAQPILNLAHRIAWRYKKSRDPHHSDTYTFNEATLLQFAEALTDRRSQDAQAEPLTEEQVKKASLDAGMQEHYMGFHSGFIRFARAIERAHRIGEKP